jgi:hypothetical protein
LRFGESLPNPYAEGEALYWFHLACAACMRGEKLLSALDAASAPIAEREELRALAEASRAHPRLERLASAERAPSGRAHCRLCRELIEKGHWRLGLQAFEEGRMSPNGSIHVECAEAYFGTADILGRVRRLTPGLDEAQREDLAQALATQRAAPDASAAPGETPNGDADSAPGLAKAGEAPAADEAARRPRYGR